MIATVFSFLFPSLVIMMLLQMGTHRLNWKTVGWRPALILFLVSVFIASFPVKGLPLGRWLFSFNANFSITLTALLFCRVWQKAMGIKLFRPIDFQAAWIFSAITGLVLYPMALGMGPFDPYTAGWGFSWLSVKVLMITIILAFLKNRFAVVLLLAVLAWNLRLLESRNLWDYFTDPFLTIFSLVMLIIRGIESLRKRPLRETR